MEKTIQAQNIFEYQQFLALLMAIKISSESDEMDSKFVKKICNKICARIKNMESSEPIEYIDKFVMGLAASGTGKMNCIKAYRDYWKDIFGVEDIENIEGLEELSFKHVYKRVNELCGVYF